MRYIVLIILMLGVMLAGFEPTNVPNGLGVGEAIRPFVDGAGVTSNLDIYADSLSVTTINSDILDITNGTITTLDVVEIKNTLASDLTITPKSGQKVIIDSHTGIDGNTITGLTNANTVITAYAGKAIVAEGVTIDGGSLTATTLTDGTASITGGVGSGFSSLTSTALVGTLSTAAQTNITSLGTLTALQVDNINVNGNAITSTAGDITITPLAGEDVVIDGHFEFDGNVLTGLTDANTTITAYAGKAVVVEGVSFDGTNVSGMGTLGVADNITLSKDGNIGIIINAGLTTIPSISLRNNNDEKWQIGNYGSGSNYKFYIYDSINNRDTFTIDNTGNLSIYGNTSVAGKIETTSTATDSIKTAGGYLSTIAVTTNITTDAVLVTTIPDTSYGLVVVRELTGTEACVFLIAGGTIEKIGADATFTVTKDNASTYNVYFESNVIKVQNKVGDNKNIAVGLYSV